METACLRYASIFFSVISLWVADHEIKQSITHGGHTGRGPWPLSHYLLWASDTCSSVANVPGFHSLFFHGGLSLYELRTSFEKKRSLGERYESACIIHDLNHQSMVTLCLNRWFLSIAYCNDSLARSCYARVSSSCSVVDWHCFSFAKLTAPGHQQLRWGTMGTWSSANREQVNVSLVFGRRSALMQNFELLNSGVLHDKLV
jgi:hypothetical protein